MDKKTNEVINKYISSVANMHTDLLKVFLFGSYAKQSERPDSDIDIAFIIKDLKEDDKFDLQVQLMLLAADFDYRIEPHPISNSDFSSEYPFALEIKNTGIEIKPELYC